MSMRLAPIALLLCTACSTSLVAGGEPVELELAVGERAQAEDNGPSIEFLRVAADSRCPSDVTCVWAGDGAVVLRYALDATAGDTTLHTAVPPRSMRLGDYTIEVVDLRPTPVSTVPVDPDRYRVLLRVQRH